jgi:ketosteroid isomerase-like protein
MRAAGCAFAASVALGLALAGAAVAHPPSVLTDEAEKATAEEVRDFRKTVIAAIERKDAAALRLIYADSFVHTHGSGKVDNKDARIVSALAGDPVIETAPVTDLVIRVPGGWTAIATGVSPIRSMADGKTYNFRWTVTYVRMGEGWQIAASHATRLGEVKP